MKFPARNNTAFKQPQSFIVNFLIICKTNFKASASELTRVFYVQTQFQRKLFSSVRPVRHQRARCQIINRERTQQQLTHVNSANGGLFENRKVAADVKGRKKGIDYNGR